MRTPEFLTDFTELYVVSLAFDRKDIGRVACLIGEESVRGSCKETATGLDVELNVFNRHRLVLDRVDYRQSLFSDSGEVDIELGRFEGTRGELYWLELRIHKMAPELVAAHPRLKVKANRKAWENWIELEGYSIYISVPLIWAGAGRIRKGVRG